MKKSGFCALLVSVCASLLLIIGFTIGCSEERATGVQYTTLEQLFTNPDKYNGKQVIVEGFYFHGFETIVLSERLEYSGYAEGHLIPRGKMLWVEGGIPKEIYDQLNQQQMMGPSERYGKVKITGKFEYGGKYGHIGGYDQQITPTETTILPWSPPASETSKGEGFAIYLPAHDIPVSQMPILSHVDLADKPLISLVDIVSYSRSTHEIELTSEAYSRITNLEVSVSGKAFLVCIDHYPVYWGAFWTPISSISFDGVAIMKPLSSDRHVIKLELGYPSPQFFKGEDYRADPTILRSLERTGKLH